MISGTLNSRRMAAFIASTSTNPGWATQIFAEGVRIPLTFTQNGIPPHRLRLGAAQEKFDSIVHPLGKLVRPSEIHSPLTDDSIEQSFHELGQVHDRKVTGYLAVFLAFCDDFPEKAYCRCLRTSQLR